MKIVDVRIYMVGPHPMGGCYAIPSIKLGLGVELSKEVA